MTLLLILLCVCAVVLELLCMRKSSIPDNDLSKAGRRIRMAGYLFFVFRFVELLFRGESIPTPGAIALALIAFGDVVRCANRLTLPDVLIGLERRA